MAQFIKAAEQYTVTENGAITNRNFSNTDSKESYDGRMGVFFHIVRGTSRYVVLEKFKKAEKESLKDALVLLFNLRDCRGGKGERQLFYWAYEYLSTRTSAPLYTLIPEYGRMDEFVKYAPIKLIAQKLDEDYAKMIRGESITLLAKWMPSENSSLDREFQPKFGRTFVQQYCMELATTPKDYRKKLTEMRSYLNIVEKFISSGKWSEIEYSKVPSKAMHNLKKAFEKHDPERFKEFAAAVKRGEQKVNAGQLFPHELLNQVNTTTGTAYDILQEQWKSLVQKYKVNGCPEWVPVCDVSGSMTSGLGPVAPIDVCTALGILLSECLNGPFKNKIITFSESPTWHNVSEGDLAAKKNKLMRAPWGMTTNLYKTFEMLATIAKAGNVRQDDMPGLIIFSDMQFDSACKNYRTNFEQAKVLFASIGHTRLPKIVFWNLSSKCLDFPVIDSNVDVGLVSGFSPALMTGFLESGDLSPVGLLRKTLDSERYQPVVKLLSESQ